jgi:peptide/nickel transport system ATP-binding protein
MELLRRAGITEPAVRARQYPHELSGGLRQRALIAVALAGRPKLIIADEPTSALDVTVQRQILDHIQQLAAASGTAVLLITHHLGVASERASRIAVMSDGVVVEEGPSAEVLAAPAQPYTRKLLAAAPSLSTTPLRARQTAAEDILLAADGLAKSFARPSDDSGPNSVRAVDGVSFTIPRGQTLALVGESGSGKTTTARMVMRLETPSAGKISFDGQDITGLSGERLRLLRRRIQLVYQNPYASLNPQIHHLRHRLGTVAGVRHRLKGGTPSPRRRADRPGRAAVGHAHPQARGALRRATPARRDRPRTRAAARTGGV